jgi:hypothetical protein
MENKKRMPKALKAVLIIIAVLAVVTAALF